MCQFFHRVKYSFPLERKIFFKAHDSLGVIFWKEIDLLGHLRKNIGSSQKKPLRVEQRMKMKFGSIAGASEK